VPAWHLDAQANGLPPPAASMKHGTLDAWKTRRLASRRPSARRIGRLVFAAAARYRARRVRCIRLGRPCRAYRPRVRRCGLSGCRTKGGAARRGVRLLASQLGACHSLAAHTAAVVGCHRRRGSHHQQRSHAENPHCLFHRLRLLTDRSTSPTPRAYDAMLWSRQFHQESFLTG
jgi:hypothetical protein